MKKVSYDKVDHIISTKGKSGSKQYAFNDFSDLIDVRDNMRKNEPKKEKRKKVKSNKIVKIVPFSGTMRITHTHITVACEPRTIYNEEGEPRVVDTQVHVINRYLTTNNVRTRFPNVIHLNWSIEQEVFGDEIFFQNTK